MRHTLLLLLSLLSIAVAAQKPTAIGQEFDFVMYLLGNGMKEEASIAINRTHLSGDSIDFLKGYTCYNLHQLDSATTYFGQVGTQSALYTEALFYGGISHSHLGHYEQALHLLQHLPQFSPQEENLAHFEVAGIKLLQRDLPAFDSCFALIDTTDFRLATEAHDLLDLRHTIALHKEKQPWVAGLCSAVVPGLGKVYAGNLGEGTSSFLLTGGLMAITAENYIRNGSTHWLTIAAGLLSAVFYVGNIYGSIATVKVGLNTFNQRNDVQILYDIHIPIRTHYRR